MSSVLRAHVCSCIKSLLRSQCDQGICWALGCTRNRCEVTTALEEPAWETLSQGWLGTHSGPCQGTASDTSCCRAGRLPLSKPCCSCCWIEVSVQVNGDSDSPRSSRAQSGRKKDMRRLGGAVATDENISQLRHECKFKSHYVSPTP